MVSGMLPPPASARLPGKPRIFFPSTREPVLPISQQLVQGLRSRSRLTNLAVTIMIIFLSFSLILNALHLGPFAIAHGSSHWRPFSSSAVQLQGWDDNATREQLSTGVPLSLETTIDRDGRWDEINHLILVPGHAIWVGHDPKLVEQDDEWILEPIQKGGSVKTFLKHLREGVKRLSEDPKSMLIFSGGATRPPPSPFLPEGISYLTLAHALKLLPDSIMPPVSHDGSPSPPIPLNLRATVEEFALDSYENLLFSIARFKEMTGHWPDKITVIGYGMKRKRFEMLHRAAIGYPIDQFTYVGIDNEGDTTENYAGELKYGYTPFLSSPAGCHPPLSIKRQLRNPYFRYHSYHTSCPELIPLLEWCPPIDLSVGEDARGLHVFEGDLPWRGKPKGEKTWGREGY